MLGYKDFKQMMEKLKSSVLSYIDELSKIDKKEIEEIGSIQKEIELYADNVSKKTLKLFNSYSNEIKRIKEEINGDYISLNVKKETVKFSSYENALLYLNENSNKVIEMTNELNKYKFEESSLSYSFDGEKLEVNSRDYSAPKFPNLTVKDFNTDNNHKILANNLYALCTNLESCLKYLIECVGNKVFKDSINVKQKSLLKDISSEIINKNNVQSDSLLEKLKEEFNSKYFKVLKENRDELNNYLSINNFSMPEEFKTTINIGSIGFEFMISKHLEQIRSIDKENLLKSNMMVPFVLDLEKKGNILINTRKNDKKVVDFVHQLIMQFIASNPYKKVNLSLVDIGISEFDFVFNYSKEYLKDNKLLYDNGIITEEDQLKDAIISLNRKLIDVKGNKLSLKNCSNVYEYNRISKENSQELNLLVIVNYPKHMTSASAEKLLNLIKHGNKCGIFTIIVNDESYNIPSNSYEYDQETHNSFIKSCGEDSYVFEFVVTPNHYSMKYSNDGEFTFDGKLFEPNYGFTSENINNFFSKLDYECDNLVNTNIIKLESIININYERKPYYQQLKMPVGKDGGEPVYFELDVDGTGTSSCIVAGGTGSGKSSFLHSIILSGAYNYSPDELEYYLIDFKNGDEFSHYSDKEGINIPHVSFLSLRNKVEDAYDILTKIEYESNRRSEYFQKVKASDIKSYQNRPEVIQGKYPSFKRLVVIIDEYQEFLTSVDTNTSLLCNKCEALLSKLLFQIRNKGISIILSSQEIALSREALGQIYNRYIFSSSGNVLQVAFPEFSGDDLSNDLNKEKGLVYKTTNGGASKKLFKAAYSGITNEKEQKQIAKLINEKWSSYSENKLTISGGDKPLLVYSSNAPFVNFTDVELTEDNIIKSHFGESALSSDKVSVNFSDSNFSSYLILGEMKKVRNLEASIGLSFLYSLKKYGFDMSKNNLHYLDLNYNDYAKRDPSPFHIYSEQLEDIMTYSVRDVDEITNSINYDKIINSINDLYNEYLSRKEQSKLLSRRIQTPILLIVNSFSYLEEIDASNSDSSSSINDQLDYLISPTLPSTSNSDESLIDKVQMIYSNGYLYNMFVVIQERKASIFNKFDRFINLSKVICCDVNEVENCQINENGGTITITDLPENYVVLFPNVSKVRPYLFDKSSNEKQFIKKFVEVLKNE